MQEFCNHDYVKQCRLKHTEHHICNQNTIWYVKIIVKIPLLEIEASDLVTS